MDQLKKYKNKSKFGSSLHIIRRHRNSYVKVNHCYIDIFSFVETCKFGVDVRYLKNTLMFTLQRVLKLKIKLFDRFHIRNPRSETKILYSRFITRQKVLLPS